MKTIIIGCKTMENELKTAMRQCGSSESVVWIESGLHNTPGKLRNVLQEKIDTHQDAERILFAMGFCGNSIAGLQSRGAELVIPRVDDCISLLCGSCEERLKVAHAYFFTEGWLRGERTIWKEYQDTVEKYGEETAGELFQIMLHNYQKVVMLDTGCYDLEKAEQEIRSIADAFGLEFDCVQGTLDYLCRLLTGPWTPDRFLIIPPGGTVSENMLVLIN